MPWILNLTVVIAVVWSGIYTVSYAYWEIRRKNYGGALISIITVAIMLAAFYYYASEGFGWIA